MRLFAFALTLALLFPRPVFAQDEVPTSWERFVKYTCDDLRIYLANHSEAEARAEAARLHFPDWLVKRFEACLRSPS